MTEKVMRDGTELSLQPFEGRADPASPAPHPSPTCSLHFPDSGLGFVYCVKVFHTLQSLQSNAPIHRPSCSFLILFTVLDVVIY